MQIPTNDKKTLGIVQSYIVLQMYLYSLKSFGIEIAISDTSKTKRRLMFSTSCRDIVINTLHCRIPLVNIPIGTWLNLSIDVLSFVSECFKSQTFRSIDYICITANSKIRRIFSMRNSLTEWNKTNNEEFPMEYGEILPKCLALPTSVMHENINFNIEKLRQYLNEPDTATQSGQFNQGKGSFGSELIQAAPKNPKEGVTSTYNTNNEVLNINNNYNLISDSSPLVNRKNTNNVEHQNPSQTPLIVNGTYTSHKKSNVNQRIVRNSSSPNKKILEIRSKSQNRPIKNVNTNYNLMINYDGQELRNDLRIMSKSPENLTDEENSTNMEINLQNKQAKHKNNQLMKIEMMKNNFKIKTNNKYNPMNLKKPIKLNQNLISSKNQLQNNKKAHKNMNPVHKSKLHSSDLDNPNLQTEEIDSNLMLLNTLNYKNIEKWEMSKDNIADSIEEIFEIEEKKNVNNWENNNYNNLNANRKPVHLQEKNRTEETQDKFYYDIPIKDNKKKTDSNYKDSSNFFNSNTKFNKYKESSSAFGDNLNTLDTKRQIIAEILKESQNTLTWTNRDRPFTPPFTKLVPMCSVQSMNKSNVILERAKEETLNSDIHSSEIIQKNNSINEFKSDLKNSKPNIVKENISNNSFHINQTNNLKTGDVKTHHDIDLIYDHLLGCYYDPKTNMYYELKNN